MAVTREQFESGMTYAAYKDQMTRNRDQVEQNEKELQLKPEDVQAFRELPETLNVMALGHRLKSGGKTAALHTKCGVRCWGNLARLLLRRSGSLRCRLAW